MGKRKKERGRGGAEREEKVFALVKIKSWVRP